jgi:hypothetical protein
MVALALYDVYVLLGGKNNLKSSMNKSPGNKIQRKSHRLLYYIINRDNMYQYLANFVVDTTFFSHNVMKEKMLALMLKKKWALFQPGTAASCRCNCRFYWDVATSFLGNGDNDASPSTSEEMEAEPSIPDVAANQCKSSCDVGLFLMRDAPIDDRVKYQILT